MRKKKNLVPRMERCEACLVREPYELFGKWRTLMPEAKALHLELGCGKGRFTAGTAAAEPDALLIAVELVPDAMVVAMERCTAAGLKNVYFVSANADQLPQFFAPGEVDRIYINFCDPWPSKRHAKRRLTHGNFLRLYQQVLAPGGQIHFKTDNAGLFDFSLEEFPRFGFALSEVTRNLHEHGPVGIMTDYEAKFHELGQPIHRLVATIEDNWTDPGPDRTVWMDAEVLALRDGSFLARDQSTGLEVIVHTRRAGEFQPGDRLHIRTNGAMMMSLPPQVNAEEIIHMS